MAVSCCECYLLPQGLLNQAMSWEISDSLPALCSSQRLVRLMGSAPFQDRAACPPAVLVQPLSPGSSAQGMQHPHRVCAAVECAAAGCGLSCVVMPGLSPFPEPLLHLPGQQGLILPCSTLWCPWASSNPCAGGLPVLQLCSNPAGEAEGLGRCKAIQPWEVLIPSHVAPGLEDFRIMQAFCWKTLIHHSLDFQAECTCV